MDAGRILQEGEPETLKRALQTGEHVSIETDRPITDEHRDALLAIGAANWRSAAPRHVEVQSRPGEGVGRRASQWLEENGYAILHLTIAPVTLEDVFFSWTGRGLRE